MGEFLPLASRIHESNMLQSIKNTKNKKKYCHIKKRLYLCSRNRLDSIVRSTLLFRHFERKLTLLITKKLLSKKEMKEMNKKNYLSPMVEIMNARVEKGFQMSGTTDPELNTTIEPEVEGPEIDFNSFD